MSVKFILGRGGSGKSTYMLDKIQERVQDNETSPVILLLPEQPFYTPPLFFLYLSNVK